MARDGSVLVKFLADTLGFRRGTEDMQDALDDAARATERDTKKMSEAFRRAGDKINHETKDIGKETSSNIKEAGKETGAEFIANMGEGIGSGKVDLKDAFLGTVGGIAPALGPAGVGVAIAASLILSITSAMDEQRKKVKLAAMTLFDAMREGIVDASTKEDLLQQALGVDNMYDAIAKAREEAKLLGVPVSDVLQYLQSAGQAATPALTAALSASAGQTERLRLGLRGSTTHLTDSARAAKELTDQAAFTATAWKDAASAVDDFGEGVKRAARNIQALQAAEAAEAAAARYRAGDPRFGGGAPGGRRA